MQARQKQAIEAYQRVQDFLTANPPPESAGLTVQKKILDDVVAKLTDHSNEQVAWRRLTRGETQRQQSLRTILRERHLAPIAQIARATLADAPGIEKALKMPKSNLSTMKLAAEGAGIRTAIAKYESAFVESGRPADFLTQLDQVIAALRESVVTRARGFGRTAGAREGIDKELRRGRKAVELIDTIVKTAFVSDSDVLLKWRMAKRVQASPGGNGGGAAFKATGGTADENLAPSPALTPVATPVAA